MTISPRLLAVVVAAAVTTVAAVSRRPVKPPEATGAWLPSSRQPTRR